MSKNLSIVELVDQLPQDNITTKVLNALNYVMPGEWHNIVGFENTITHVTSVFDAKTIKRIRDRCVELYDNPKEGYQGAIQLYQTIDKADSAIATAALANKVGEKIGFLSFLNKITPKADTAQGIDLVLKIVVEILAYCKINGLPKPNPSEFVSALNNNYTDAALMRMVALVCIDGMIPLGPDFLTKIHTIIDSQDSSTITQNPVFSSLNNNLPGENTQAKLGFISQSFNAMQGWMDGLIQKTGITPQSLFKNLGSFLAIADDNLDFVAAFLDKATNYYEHTGIQTVARSLILKAHQQILAEPSPTISDNNNDSNEEKLYKKNQKVEVLADDDYWYSCKILKSKDDGKKYLIRYLDVSDPDEDEWMKAKHIRLPGSYEEGEIVEVYDGDDEWYEGTIIEIYDDNTYLIEYEDEDGELEEEEVRWQYIRYYDGD